MKNKLYISIGLVIAIVLLANLISQDFFVRLDFTEDRTYTLNNATKDLLKDLKEPVTVKAYYSENLPPDIAKGRKDLKELLIEYGNLSKGMLVYEFINPGESESIEQEAMQAGIQPVMINVREKDQMKQQKAYLGAIVSMGERKEVIPLMQPGSALEYALSTAIKKLSVVDKPVIGLIQGHGEPSINEMIQAYGELQVLYNIEPLTLTDTTYIPDRIKTIAIVRPNDSIPMQHFAQFDNFLSRGGRVYVAFNRVEGDLQHASGSAKNTGLESWLSSKGLTVEDNFVTDASCAAVNVQQQQGGFSFMSQVQFPYIPVVNKFAKHPISGGLENVVFQFVSSMSFSGDTSIIFTPLLFSSDKSGSEKAPLYYDIQKQWTQAELPLKNQVLGAALEGKLAGGTQSKMVVIADGDFAIGGGGQQQQRLQPDNVNLMVNSIDWLSDESGLIGLRTKSTTSRPIEQMEDGSKTTLKWLNFLLPLLLVVGYGFFRFQAKRSQRLNRMEQNYN
jgi:gliding-associated putative ABC transporter substrate-binding component GldG